jgi:hypothetical protein
MPRAKAKLGLASSSLPVPNFRLSKDKWREAKGIYGLSFEKDDRDRITKLFDKYLFFAVLCPADPSKDDALKWLSKLTRAAESLNQLLYQANIRGSAAERVQDLIENKLQIGQFDDEDIRINDPFGGRQAGAAAPMAATSTILSGISGMPNTGAAILSPLPRQPLFDLQINLHRLMRACKETAEEIDATAEDIGPRKRFSDPWQELIRGLTTFAVEREYPDAASKVDAIRPPFVRLGNFLQNNLGKNHRRHFSSLETLAAAIHEARHSVNNEDEDLGDE